VVIGERYARTPEFTHYDPSILIGHEVTGSTLGIVGLGRIGKKVAQRARGFEMQLLYHNRRRDVQAEADLGVQYVSFDELLAESDFVALNCPLTKDTTKLIGAAQLAKMKPTAILINMARGPVVDGEALYEALGSKRIAAAALDVTDPEPLPRDHRLLSLPNLIITPHLGSASDRTRRRMMEMTVENLLAGLRGEPLPYRVA
jgi:glyoxylate reductase